MNTKKQRVKYIVFDLLAAMIAWLVFNTYRELYIAGASFDKSVYYISRTGFWLALIGIPLLWIFIYQLFGHYRNVWQRSRLIEVWQTFITSIFGITVIFFVLLLDDTVKSYKDYYSSFLFLFCVHFFATWFFRYIITSINLWRINYGKIGFKTLLIGSDDEAFDLYNQIQNDKERYGYDFVGFVGITKIGNKKLENVLQNLGNLSDLAEIIEQNKIKEVIIAIENPKNKVIDSILMQLRSKDVLIKVTPALSELLTGKVRLSFFMGTPLVVVNHELMKPWQQNFKRVFDIAFSILGILLFSPFFIFVILGIKFTSKGLIFYKQERIGKDGKPFMIHKFRTMYIDAEKDGPQLSSAHDPRITPFGRFMRKYRVDEIPQFINVLKGDMSVVGPRPERKFYIDQIIKEAPHYEKLLAVKPGITSWGAVKYGYTENLEQMFEQLKYDIYYVRNMSLLLDFKILFKTISIVLRRDGK